MIMLKTSKPRPQAGVRVDRISEILRASL